MEDLGLRIPPGDPLHAKPLIRLDVPPTDRRALIIGASGLVGGSLQRLAAGYGWDAYGTSSRELDIRNPAQIDRWLDETNPMVVLLPAALGNVEYCEQNPEQSYSVNVTGTANVAAAVSKRGLKIVYFSTDYVFDGVDGPYSEDGPPNPVNCYGRHKLEAERVAANGLIVRTTVVYGIEQQGKNFLYRLIETLRSGRRLPVPADQIGSPTYVEDLARAVWELIEKDAAGVFNIAGDALADRYEFACEAAKTFGLSTSLIVPVTTAELNQRAARPLRAGMTLCKLRAALGWTPRGYREALPAFARDWRNAYPANSAALAG